MFWQCSHGTVETQRLYQLRHGPQRAIKFGFFGLINSIICSPCLVFHSRVRTEFVIVFNWNYFEMRLLNLRINFFICCELFLLILLDFVLFLLYYVSAKFHLWPSSSDRNTEFCNRIHSNYCLPELLSIAQKKKNNNNSLIKKPHLKMIPIKKVKYIYTYSS